MEFNRMTCYKLQANGNVLMESEEYDCIYAMPWRDIVLLWIKIPVPLEHVAIKLS